MDPWPSLGGDFSKQFGQTEAVHHSPGIHRHLCEANEAIVCVVFVRLWINEKTQMKTKARISVNRETAEEFFVVYVSGLFTLTASQFVKKSVCSANVVYGVQTLNPGTGNWKARDNATAADSVKSDVEGSILTSPDRGGGFSPQPTKILPNHPSTDKFLH